MNILCEATHDTPIFSLEGKILAAKAVDVYDGDTATFCVLLKDEVCAFKMRLSGIDTPEMRPSRSSSTRNEEKAASRYVRNRLIQLLTDQDVDLYRSYSRRAIRELMARSRKLVYLKCGKAGKFGRVLVHVFLNRDDVQTKELCFNRTLIREGLAYRYHGDTKNDDFHSYFDSEVLAGVLRHSAC